MNHSYIGTSNSDAVATERNRRMDLVVDRDNLTMVVGVNNGSANPLPQLFAHSYNTISVGLTSGNHSHGLTTINGAGRVKPDIVAPQGTTSAATPLVSSAATLLRHQGALSGNPDATLSEITKAVLMAGATKDEFPNWSQTETQPLDLTFGVGEQNVYNSYQILNGGEVDGALDVASALNIPAFGWDYGESLAAAQSLHYDFEVLSDLAEASILLTWNVQVSDAGGPLDFDTLDFTNLDLQLYTSLNGQLGTLVGQSISTANNVEHLYFQDLGLGSYTLAVSNAAQGSLTDFGLAWRITAVPEPSAMALLTPILFSSVYWRRRRFPS
jgi:hypothetical protein